ncbi:MAG: hypothetical protein M3033_18420 [Acidobacteriota bacterium]|nr:hypothetical protein [Acidobacteriota bacterium]
MKNLPFASLLVLIFCFASFAQTNKTSKCPTIFITVPPGFPIPNEPIIYTATIGKEVENYNVKYDWTVANGKIIEGQGTLVAKVLQNDIAKNLTVTFEVSGLLPDCSNIASETMAIDLVAPQAFLIKEFSAPIAQIEKAKIFEKLTALEDNPNSRLYIIFRHTKNTPQKIITRKERKLFDNLIKAGIERERITLIKDFANTESVQFWLVPAGATPPKIND